MQSRMTPASYVGKGVKLMDSGDDFSEDILEKASEDWEAIMDNLID
jgi:hypothetical protein